MGSGFFVAKVLGVSNIYNNQLHIISTGQQSINTFIQVIKQIYCEVDYIHLREKSWTAIEYINVINMLIKVGVPLQKIIVNDRIDIAYIMNCYGVQLATHSIDISLVKNKFETLHIGCSVHSVEEAIAKEQAGAHYLLYGHIYDTASKQNVQPRGLTALSKVVHAVNIPVIAIGGIRPSNIADTLQTGASGIAVLSGILLADDPLKMVKQYREEMKRRDIDESHR